MKVTGEKVHVVFKSFNKLQPVLLLQGLIIGLSSGFMVILYRLVIEEGAYFAKQAYSMLAYASSLVPLWFILLVIAAYTASAITKDHPLTGGGGVPQVKGALLKNTEDIWWKVIAGRFICGFLCILSGLSLGRVGPSIHIGALVGQRLSRVFSNFNKEDKYAVICGASAGLAAALNAPLTGTIFAFECIYMGFNPTIFLSALSAAVASSFASKLFFGYNSIFSFQHSVNFSYTGYLHFVVLGIILGISGTLFNNMFVMSSSLYKSIKFIPSQFKLAIPFLIAGIMGLSLPEVIGGGSELIDLLNSTSFTLSVLVVLFIAKFCLTITSVGSGASGGLFFPVLSIGALLGCIYGNIATLLFHIEPGFTALFIILSMGGYFTAVIRTPITGIILIIEITGSFTYLPPLAVVTAVSYITANSLGTKPIFQTMSERSNTEKLRHTI